MRRAILGSMIFGVIISCFYIFWFCPLHYMDNGIYDENNTLSKKYTDCLYFSIVTWTSLGYGDFRPHSDSRAMAALEAIIGQIFMSIVLGFLLWLSIQNHLKIKKKSKTIKNLDYGIFEQDGY